MVTATAPVWTGWLVADLDVAAVEVSVRVDIVSLWLGSRTLAVVDRDRLRGWVEEPRRPLLVDDVAFVLVDRQLCLSIDEAGPFPLPTEFVSQLVGVL